jgi:ribonuclease R
VAGGEHSDLLNELILRSQAQAEYSSANIGHFGLNLRRYAHFTSPIRRYADLIVHRALVSACELGEGGLSAAERDRLAAVAEQISQAERKAISAERETVDRLIALHMAERIGEEFHGRISGVTRSGLFVKLKETGADGFIPAATLGRDYYRHVEAAHALVNERTGDSYRVGDNVDVKLIECVPSAGALRFEMVSDGKYRPELSKAVRKRGGRSSLRGLRGSGGRGKSSRKVKR